MLLLHVIKFVITNIYGIDVETIYLIYIQYMSMSIYNKILYKKIRTNF